MLCYSEQLNIYSGSTNSPSMIQEFWASYLPLLTTAAYSLTVIVPFSRSIRPSILVCVVGGVAMYGRHACLWLAFLPTLFLFSDISLGSTWVISVCPIGGVSAGGWVFCSVTCLLGDHYLIVLNIQMCLGEEEFRTCTHHSPLYHPSLKILYSRLELLSTSPHFVCLYTIPLPGLLWELPVLCWPSLPALFTLFCCYTIYHCPASSLAFCTPSHCTRFFLNSPIHYFVILPSGGPDGAFPTPYMVGS